MQLDQLKIFLDKQVETFEQPEFIIQDPLGIVKRFDKKQDQEIIGLLSSTIAWGNRKAIIQSTERMLKIMDNQPFDFLSNTSEKDWQHLEFIHRTFNAEDLKFFFASLKSIYEQHNSLEELFAEHPKIAGIQGRIIRFREQFCAIPHLDRSEKHISNPAKGSSSKRMNMFLRWMVRSSEKGVDLDRKSVV
jgi:uncharacterized protein (TIGR02757 family)